MLVQRVVLCLVVAASRNVQPVATETTPTSLNDAAVSEGEKKLSEKLMRVLEHFQQPNPVGLPGAEIPDPYPIPDMKHSFPLATMYFTKVKTRGLSKFRIESVSMEIAAMEVKVAMTIDKLLVTGDYKMSTWFSTSTGPFTVNLTDIYAEGTANLAIDRDGQIRAQDILMDMSFKTINLNFENLGFFASMFQGMINSIGSFLFDSIKPFVQKEAYAKIRSEIDNNLKKIAGDMQFPNSISPLDMVVADARKKVREMGWDPYFINDYNSTVGLFSVSLSHTWLTGMSSFQRVGNITLGLENNTLIADFEIGTQKLVGQTQWDVTAVGGVMSRAGTASFSVEYISARIVLAQPMDIRKKAEFRDVQLELGNIQVRCDGAGTLDYLVEFVVNILPNLLRYQIVDALEGPLLEKGQQELDKIDVEGMVKEKLPELDTMKEFKLSEVFATNATTTVYDEDEFFNF